MSPNNALHSDAPVIFAAILATSLAQTASAATNPIESSYHLAGSDLFAQMDAYASASGLSPPTSKSSAEIRVWADNYMSGEVIGYIVTHDGISICEMETDYDDGVVTIQPANCRAQTSWKGQKPVLSKLEELSRFDNSRVDCGVMDGTGYAIDGILNGRRFAFTADNPQQCSDEVSRAVEAVLRLLPSSNDAP